MLLMAVESGLMAVGEHGSLQLVNEGRLELTKPRSSESLPMLSPPPLSAPWVKYDFNTFTWTHSFVKTTTHLTS